MESLTHSALQLHFPKILFLAFFSSGLLCVCVFSFYILFLGDLTYLREFNSYLNANNSHIHTQLRFITSNPPAHLLHTNILGPLQLHVPSLQLLKLELNSSSDFYLS